jgi:hypothetical protein
MKRILLILGLSFLIGAGLSILYVQVVPLTDDTTLYSESDQVKSYDSSQAPPEALQGSVTYMDGEVMWQSRSATEAATLYGSTSILQGEEVETGEDGEITILFDNDTLIDIFSESSVSFTQTLPANIVITHRRGEVEYSQDKSTHPLSVRVGHLLVRLHSGIMSITFDEIKNEDDEIVESLVTVRVRKGSATTAYNSLEYETNYTKLNEGESLLYNNISRESDII